MKMQKMFQYVCRTVFHYMTIDDQNKDSLFLELLNCKKNLSSKLPYYSFHKYVSTAGRRENFWQ